MKAVGTLDVGQFGGPMRVVNWKADVDEIVAISPETVMIAMEVPGRADAVITRLKRGRLLGVRPIVIGSAPAGMLSSQAGVPVSNCFACPVRARTSWTAQACMLGSDNYVMPGAREPIAGVHLPNLRVERD